MIGTVHAKLPKEDLGADEFGRDHLISRKGECGTQIEVGGQGCRPLNSELACHLAPFISLMRLGSEACTKSRSIRLGMIQCERLARRKGCPLYTAALVRLLISFLCPYSHLLPSPANILLLALLVHLPAVILPAS